MNKYEAEVASMNEATLDGIRHLATQTAGDIPQTCAAVVPLELLMQELVSLRLSGKSPLFLHGKMEYVLPMWKVGLVEPEEEGNLEVVFANPAPDLGTNLDYNIATFSRLHQNEIVRDSFVVEHNSVRFICRRLTLSGSLKERSQIVDDLRRFAAHTFVLGSTSNTVL